MRKLKTKLFYGMGNNGEDSNAIFTKIIEEKLEKEQIDIYEEINVAPCLFMPFVSKKRRIEYYLFVFDLPGAKVKEVFHSASPFIASTKLYKEMAKWDRKLGIKK